MPEQLIGPFGALFALSIAIGILWRSHEKSDKDNQVRLDRTLAVSEEQTKQIGLLIVGVDRNSKSIERLSAAAEKRARDDATRRRATDPK